MNIQININFDHEDETFHEIEETAEGVRIKAQAKKERAMIQRDLDLQSRLQLPTNKRVKLYHSSCEELCHHVADESIDLILTDPPSHKKYLYCWNELGFFAINALKPGGSLIAMGGQAWMIESMNHLKDQGLDFQWTLSYQMRGERGERGASRIINRRIFRSRWKPVYWFTKGETDVSQQICDILHSPNSDKDHHDWGHSVDSMLPILHKLTSPNDLVCDPFLGGGSYAIAAMKAKCNFVGADIDQHCVQKTHRRIIEAYPHYSGEDIIQEVSK